MVRQFETGGDAAASVITTALYQALPPAEGEEADQPGEGRKLLLFSDSRQAAAFFAPYLETSYETIQHRRLILDALSSATTDDETAQVDDVAFHLVRAADQAHVFERRRSRQERQRETSLWLMAELVATDDRQSLEGRGLLRADLGREPSWRLPAGLGSLGLSQQESWDLLGELVRSRRTGQSRAPPQLLLVQPVVPTAYRDPHPAHSTPSSASSSRPDSSRVSSSSSTTTGVSPASSQTRGSVGSCRGPNTNPPGVDRTEPDRYTAPHRLQVPNSNMAAEQVPHVSRRASETCGPAWDRQVYAPSLARVNKW